MRSKAKRVVGSEGERGFTLLEVMLSLVAISLFLVLAIDPYLNFQKQKTQLIVETRRLDEMASKQVVGDSTGYRVEEGKWCLETLCLASRIRNDPPRNFNGPLVESSVTPWIIDDDTTR
ncbi:prepilin-type N-terminal cleavage/methylation domain-containing protein [Exiguobacterium oxidotolerans]|uniref:Prepilin-type cleavage/methylation domain-containing protein n=1 Tax=Exiguobacterium oxidotolerans TaxID=223958 RepID=A0A653IG37_9BACL|nr:Prepilin-type cleavage/methylation domain-containing protein [Exiguobacterium oxidotolerans]